MATLYIPDPAIEWPHESTARARARAARSSRSPVARPRRRAAAAAAARREAAPRRASAVCRIRARRRVRRLARLLPLLRGESVTGAPAQPVALVTGAGRGIGREIALALAREGCHVAVAARSSDQVAATAAAVAASAFRRFPLVLDVTDEARRHARRRLGRREPRPRRRPRQQRGHRRVGAVREDRRRRSGSATCASTRPAPIC